jgi:hypothetical protein
MKKDVRQKRSHEEKCGRARILDADDTRFVRATEIAGDDLQTAARRTVVVPRIERDDERWVGPLVHAEHEVLDDRRAGERHPLFRDTPEDDARIRRSIDVLKVADAGGQLKVAVHRGIEERLLGVKVTKDRRRRHAELGGDIGERSRREALLAEYVAGRLKDLLPMDEWRPAHL